MSKLNCAEDANNKNNHYNLYYLPIDNVLSIISSVVFFFLVNSGNGTGT